VVYFLREACCPVVPGVTWAWASLQTAPSPTCPVHSRIEPYGAPAQGPPRWKERRHAPRVHHLYPSGPPGSREGLARQDPVTDHRHALVRVEDGLAPAPRRAHASRTRAVPACRARRPRGPGTQQALSARRAPRPACRGRRRGSAPGSLPPGRPGVRAVPPGGCHAAPPARRWDVGGPVGSDTAGVPAVSSRRLRPRAPAPDLRSGVSGRWRGPHILSPARIPKESHA